jgi:hypothetical protein
MLTLYVLSIHVVASNSACAPRRLADPRIAITPNGSTSRARNAPSRLALISAHIPAHGHFPRTKSPFATSAIASRLCHRQKITGPGVTGHRSPSCQRSRHDLIIRCMKTSTTSAAILRRHDNCRGTTGPPDF